MGTETETDKTDLIETMAKGKRVERPPEGVDFPLDENNRRSTMAFNAAAFEASVINVDPGLAAKIGQEAPKWRKKYSKYVVENVKLSAKSTGNALAIANAGLDYLHDNMVFIRNERSMPLRTAMYEFKQDKFATATVKGSARMPSKQEYEVPYKNKTLRGDDLLVQIDKWVNAGVIEVSCGHAMNEVALRSEWLDLSDVYFVMLGASSAMGPYEFLMNHGANVIAVDIDRPHIWKKLITIAENSCGTLTFPMKKQPKASENLADNAGCNLLTETPEIRNWLQSVHKGKSLVIGSYAYLDGALFVKLSMAMDAIAKDLVQSRKNTALAYLCTPTDCHIGTAAANAVATKNYKRSPLWQTVLSLLVTLKRNSYRHVEDDVGNHYHCVDAIVPEQGPNYILAKRLQHWRAIVTRESGSIVSSNVAPATRTLSVVHNLSFKMAYGGMKHFKPLEVFDQETSSAVMAGLLVYDLKCAFSVRTPSMVAPGGAGTSTAPLAPRPSSCTSSPRSLSPPTSSSTTSFSSLGGPTWLTLVQTSPRKLGAWMPWSSQVPGRRCRCPCGSSRTWRAWRSCTQWMTVAIQVASRVLLVEAIAYVPEAQSNVFIYGLLLCWGVTEMVRYSFYALKLLGREVPLLTWLRYTLFLVLYPAGVTSELFCVYGVVMNLPWDAWKWVPETPLFEAKIWALALYYFVYVPFFPMLFGHMLAQRKKILGGGKSRKDKRA